LSSVIIYSINFLNLLVPQEALKEYLYTLFVHVTSVMVIFGMLGLPLTPLLLLVTIIIADAKFFLEVIDYLSEREDES
jgi:hypothetical protein